MIILQDGSHLLSLVHRRTLLRARRLMLLIKHLSSRRCLVGNVLSLLLDQCVRLHDGAAVLNDLCLVGSLDEAETLFDTNGLTRRHLLAHDRLLRRTALVVNDEHAFLGRLHERDGLGADGRHVRARRLVLGADHGLHAQCASAARCR